MFMKERQIRQLAQWMFAIVISTVILNVIVACYELTPDFIYREGGATVGVWPPNTYIVEGREGWSISKVDGNGYVNSSNELADSGYVIVMGNSQSNGVQVRTDQRYISLLNNRFQINQSNKKVYVYNVSVNGSDFCDLISGFTAAIREFPNSKAIILQIGGKQWTLDKLRNCTEQREFSEEMRGAYLGEHLSGIQRLRNIIKFSFPFLAYLKEIKMEEIKGNCFKGAFWYSDEKNNVADLKASGNDEWNDYEECLNRVLQFLRQNYSGEIIILELPDILFEDRELREIDCTRKDLFDSLCVKNDIKYINMYDIYCEEYEQYSILPYGFSNTKPGYGHLNKEGHRMVAEALYPILEGGLR